MRSEKTYLVVRGLDDTRYRVIRNSRPMDICFTDLTYIERMLIIREYDVQELQRLCLHLANCLRQIGDELDLYEA